MFTRRLPVHLVALALLCAAAPAPGSTVVSCPFGGTPQDHADSGIVVANYPGNNVRRVRAGYGAECDRAVPHYDRDPSWRLQRADRGIVEHLPQPGRNATTNVDGFFHFGGANDGAPVTPGDTLTITHTWSGPGVLFFDAGTGDFGSSGDCGGVHETIGTSSPLDVQVRGTFGIEIDQEDQTNACIKSDTVLCIANHTGDVRFQLTVDYNHAGRAPGSGQASIGTLGIADGGSFWFFSQDNPEVLVKVLNGCSVKPQVLGLRHRGNQRGFRSSRSGHRDLRNDDVLQSGQRRRGAGPGHVRVPMPVSVGRRGEFGGGAGI